MLVLKRSEQTGITLHTLDGPVRIDFNVPQGGEVKLAIDAPDSVTIARDELLAGSYHRSEAANLV